MGRTGLLQKVDILKIRHHASTTGLTLAFLNLLQPTIALYSAGINNQYGHPAPLTIASLTSVIAAIYGTDKNGVISIQVDQNGYTINASHGLVTAPLALPTAIIPIIIPILPPAGTGALEIISITSPISKGSNATLTAQTSPVQVAASPPTTNLDQAMPRGLNLMPHPPLASSHARGQSEPKPPQATGRLK